MKERVRQLVLAAGVAACCSPSVSSAFQAVDEMLWPERGVFPAYPAEPADGRTIRYSVFSGLLHDNNLFRLSDSADPVTAIGSSERSDTIFRVGAGIDANLPISRQNILLNARFELREFDRFDLLDHTAYRFGGAWNWRVGNDWEGLLGYQRDHYLSGLADIQRAVKDMITTDHAYGSAAYRIDARWRVRGGLDFWRYEHGDASQLTLDNRTGSLVIGGDYVTPANNSIGAQFRYTEGKYPNQILTINNDYKEYETSAVARWVVTGKSTFTGRVGYTKREHEQFAQRDFDGLTGRLEYDWFVANKTLLNFALYREIGSYIDTNASYVVNQGGSFGPAWAPTDKVILQARLVHEKRDYQGEPVVAVVGVPQREDTFRGIRVSAGWAPRRSVEVVLSAEHGDRNSNVSFPIDRSYDYTSYLANVRLRF
jgi:exopolysaccharide biosynthesis operon protein EpsL